MSCLGAPGIDAAAIGPGSDARRLYANAVARWMSTPDGSMTSVSGGNAPVPGVARLVVSSERYSNLSFRKSWSQPQAPSLGIFETEPSLNLREQNRHASLSPLSPLSPIFPAHHDASPEPRILPRARAHTPPRVARGVVLRRAHSRGDDENRVAAHTERPDHDNTRTTTATLGRHANSTRARRAAPSRNRQRIYT